MHSHTMHAKPEGPLPICPHWQLNEANRDTPDPRTQVSGVTPPREGEVVAPSQTLTPKTNRHSLTSHNHTCVNHSPHPLSLSLEGKTITPIAAHTPPRTWDPRVAPNAERTKRWVGGKTRCISLSLRLHFRSSLCFQLSRLGAQFIRALGTRVCRGH